jgi:hypothetical protein
LSADLRSAKVNIRFVLAPGQNLFFGEIVAALKAELDDLGVPAAVLTGPLPDPEPGVVDVLVPPHEYFALTPPHEHPAPGRLTGAIFLCAEQPGTWFFDENARLAHQHGAVVLDINRSAVKVYREQGLAADHLPLGWSAGWACPPSALDAERDLDVVHLGVWSDRRARALAGCATALVRRLPLARRSSTGRRSGSCCAGRGCC